MHKFVLATALLVTSLTANASIELLSGETYSSSFTLVSDGGAFKETDLYWDAGILVNFAGPSADATFTAYEDTAGTQEVFSSTIFNLFSGNRRFLGSNQGLFNDFNGSFRITNTGANAIELVDVIVSNFAGTALPSNVATATITPSAVPIPAAGWLLGSTLLGLFGVGRSKASS